MSEFVIQPFGKTDVYVEKLTRKVTAEARMHVSPSATLVILPPDSLMNFQAVKDQTRGE